MTEKAICYICKKGVRVPKEAKMKLERQLFWHWKCFNKLEAENKNK